MKPIFYLLIAVCIVCSCKSDFGNMPEKGGNTIYVSFDKEMSQRENFVNSIDQFSIVPLDLDSTLLVPDSQMRVTAKHVYVYSKPERAVFVFSRSGELLARIDDWGEGPENYANIRSFSIENDSVIWIDDNMGNKLMAYDVYGNFIGKRDGVRGADDELCLNDSLFLLYRKYVAPVDTCNDAFLFRNKNGEIRRSFVRLPEWHSSNSLSPKLFPFGVYDAHILWSNVWDNHIYSFTPDSVYCRYTIDYGKYTIPESFFKEHEADFKQDKIMELFDMIFTNDWVVYLNYVQESDGYVTFLFLRKGNPFYALYNKNTGECNVIQPDALGEYGVFQNPLCSCGNSFYVMCSVKNLDYLLENAEELESDAVKSLVKDYEPYRRKHAFQEDDYVLVEVKMKDYAEKQ